LKKPAISVQLLELVERARAMFFVGHSKDPTGCLPITSFVSRRVYAMQRELDCERSFTCDSASEFRN
jgi:hypothetical protein